MVAFNNKPLFCVKITSWFEIHFFHKEDCWAVQKVSLRIFVFQSLEIYISVHNIITNILKKGLKCVITYYAIYRCRTRTRTIFGCDIKVLTVELHLHPLLVFQWSGQLKENLETESFHAPGIQHLSTKKCGISYFNHISHINPNNTKICSYFCLLLSGKNF